MAKQEGKKVATKKVVKDFKKVSQSTDVVTFKCSKDSGNMKKDKEYSVSKNVAEILELKGLGKQV